MNLVELLTDILSEFKGETISLSRDRINELLQVAKGRLETKEGFTKAIYSEWWAEDVRSLDKTLTDEQVGLVLDAVMDNHDANSGINWNSIQYHIDEIK